MADRMTPERLAEIAARAEAATPGPWERLPEHGPHFVAYLQGEHLRGVGDFDFGEGDDAAADEAFTLHAREDVSALLAEVARLRGALREACDHVAEQDAQIERLTRERDGLDVRLQSARRTTRRLEAERAELPDLLTEVSDLRKRIAALQHAVRGGGS